MTESYYSMGAQETLGLLRSTRSGLTEKEASKRLDEHGPNELRKEKGSAALLIFASQFRNALIMLLVFAGLLSLFLGEAIECVAIFAIILLNAVLGFSQEYKAEKAIEALKKVSAPTARVIREGKVARIPAREVVPGDILVLEAGDIVAADSRLFELSSLHIDEASLTGESVPSGKVTEPFKKGTSVADQENMAFMGTVVTYGKGLGVVTRTGMDTEFGKIAASLEATEETQTPLQVKFTQLTKQIGMVAVSLIIVVFVAGMLQGTSSFSRMVLLALTLTVSTIPNSLPIIVTVSLSRGTKRLAKKNMLVKKLTAAESLGAATIICSDKTGTITKNQMTITDIYCDGRLVKVTGSGYDPEGSFHCGRRPVNTKRLETLMRTGYLCNNAKLSEKEGVYEIVGDPTEGSLVVLARKGGIDEEMMHANYSFVEELPFDSDRKMMSVIYQDKSCGKNEAYVKGAPDLLLGKCSRILEGGRVRKLSRKDTEAISGVNESFAAKALRVLALAYKEVPRSGKYAIESVEDDLVFVGLVGMIDPPREEVREAVQKCQEAGIRVMIITGDHAVTTKAVAMQIGLFEKGDTVLTGDEMSRMSDDELEARIDRVRIVARALPIQKSRIVDMLQKKGHIVAMTGDGVNDAPALKKANIGIAMGTTGTDVAKEVAEAILVDDNFATIVNAIEEGRGIYGKIIKSAKYLLSCNSGEITAVFLAIMMRLPLPLLPLQVLLMNLLTDDLPAMGLGSEGNEKGVMKSPPRKPGEKPISRRMFVSIVAFGVIMGLGTLFMFTQYLGTEAGKAQTVAFTTLVMFQMFAVMSSRTFRPSVGNLNVFSNKWLCGAICISVLIQMLVVYWQPMQAVFSTVPLSAIDWAGILVVSSLGFIMMELSKVLTVRIGHGRK